MMRLAISKKMNSKSHITPGITIKFTLQAVLMSPAEES